MTAMSTTGPASEGKGARTRAAIQEAAVIAFRRVSSVIARRATS